MRGTGVFEHTIRHLRNVPINTPLTLVFFGDVHYGAPCHCEKSFNEFVAKYRLRQDCWFIGMGDYLDLLSASERKVVANSGLHESTAETFEQWADKLIDGFCDKISFMRGRLLCALEGNHHYRFASGDTTGQRIMRRLNRGLPEGMQAHHGGDMCILRLVLHRKKGGTTNGGRSLDIALHHGIGGGRTTGAMFTGLDHFANAVEADVYAMGDNHQLGAVPVQKLYLDRANRGEPTLRHRKIYKLRTGSFLRGYVKGKSNYVTDKLLRPAQLGAAELNVTYTYCEIGRDAGKRKQDEFINLEATI
jgi:hypothetical protein